ncbi:hypothetical protein AB0A94_01060 [Streptomyces sp. NPDC044984]|uniref:hypothetical protein n=1 Tax=Streptomyces sp. NPDC044984 TaxID=3154335 RepID=UPI0033EFC3FF
MVWELEQATGVHDQYELPSPAAGFDEPGRLDAFLDAVRRGAIASADKTALQESPVLSPVRILLGTDAAGEGISLQAHCHRVLH